MIYALNKKTIVIAGIIALAAILIGAYFLFRPEPTSPEPTPDPPPVEHSYDTESSPPPEPPADDYIKWVEFNVSSEMLQKAYDYDVNSYGQDIKLDWVELLAYSVAKNWGNVDRSNLKSIDECAKLLKNGKTIEEITKDLKYYNYYHEAYSAILSNFLGEYEVEVMENNEKKFVKKYGLKVFSPIAKGYGYSHYDDFGMSRSYGYQRKHMGNDLLGSVGTPIIAVEGGTIEAMGWNQYGGWRIGIRSDDGLRYYYYAHLRKNHPYCNRLKEGDKVKAGDVIGYLGMTGYSTTENVNNITTPHLHFGMQLIFNEKQKDGTNQIWIDVYKLVNLLEKNRSAVVYDEATKEYSRKYDIREVSVHEGTDEKAPE